MQGSAKQRTAVSNAQEALGRSQEKLTGLEDEVAKLDLRYSELSVDPLTPSSSKVASEVGDGPRSEEVQEEVQSSDGVDLTNKFVGPDPPEPPTGSPPKGLDHLPPLALVRRLCKMRKLLNGVMLRWRYRMIRCSMQLLMCRCLNMTVHSLLLGCVIFKGWTSQPTACLLNLKAPCFLTIGNRMRGFDACEQGWVSVQRRCRRRSQGQGKQGEEF